jgi:hypothetical protein
LFKPVAALKIRDDYTGLVIRCAPVEEAKRIKASMPSVTFSDSDRVFLLESQDETDYIIGMAVGWHEDVLRHTRQSFFHSVSSDMPRWPQRSPTAGSKHSRSPSET